MLLAIIFHIGTWFFHIEMFIADIIHRVFVDETLKKEGIYSILDVKIDVPQDFIVLLCCEGNGPVKITVRIY